MDTAVRSHSVDTTVPTALSSLRPGTAATIVAVGSATEGVSQQELRLLELGFIAGERVEVVAEARPGRDPFVVRVGSTQFALRRCPGKKSNPTRRSSEADRLEQKSLNYCYLRYFYCFFRVSSPGAATPGWCRRPTRCSGGTC